MKTFSLENHLKNAAFLIYLLIYKNEENQNIFMMNATQYINKNNTNFVVANTEAEGVVKMLIRVILEVIKDDIEEFKQTSMKIQNEETTITMLYIKLIKIFRPVFEKVSVDINDVMSPILNSIIMYTVCDSNLTYSIVDDKKNNFKIVDKFYDGVVNTIIANPNNQILLGVYMSFLKHNAKFVEDMIAEYNGFRFNMSKIDETLN